MADGQDMGRGIVIGTISGAVLGVAIDRLLARAEEVKAAKLPPDEKLNYLIECQTATVALLNQLLQTSQALIQSHQQLVEGNQTVIGLLQQLLAAQGVIVEIPGEERIVTVVTQWKAAEPEEILKEAIRATGTFYTDKMVDWRQGKRIYFFIHSTLNQAVSIQVIGHMVNTHEGATDINTAKTCPAGDTISFGPAWVQWCPYIGIKIIVAIAPTSGMLTISAVRQE